MKLYVRSYKCLKYLFKLNKESNFAYTFLLKIKIKS